MEDFYNLGESYQKGFHEIRERMKNWQLADHSNLGQAPSLAWEDHRHYYHIIKNVESKNYRQSCVCLLARPRLNQERDSTAMELKGKDTKIQKLQDEVNTLKTTLWQLRDQPCGDAHWDLAGDKKERIQP